MAAFLALLLAAGGANDFWAHNHHKVDQSFFTPWHALLYGSMALNGVFFGVHALRARGPGFWKPDALPCGYWLSLVGVALFAIGGVLDLWWHTLFGIEQSIDAELSPTHLLLMFSALLIIGGPLRSAYARPGSSASWAAFGPAVFSLSGLYVIVLLFTDYASPFCDLRASRIQPPPLLDAYTRQASGMGAILLQSLLLSVFVLLITRHQRLPFGAFTTVIGLGCTAIIAQSDHYALLPGTCIAGLCADVLFRALQPLADQRRRIALCFCTPAFLYAAYFLTLSFTGGIAWTIHMIAGSIVLSGMVGAGLALAATSIAEPHCSAAR